MDIFAQNKLLIRAVIILAMLNVFSIGVFLWKDIFRANELQPPPPPHHIELSTILKEELNLTETQAVQIQELRTNFLKKERALISILRSQRDSMNVSMFNKTTDEILVKSLAKRIAENEYQMEMLRFEQAKKLKAICTPAQLEKFEELVLEIRDYFHPNKPPRRK